MNLCTLCPRACAVDRVNTLGACKMPRTMHVARAALHAGEEPCLSPNQKSGTVFFCGCALGCTFCQNHDISRGVNTGIAVSKEDFVRMVLSLQEEGAENIDLVTASHFLDEVVPALHELRGRLHIPVVYNSSGYESPRQLDLLAGLVDVYLPDFKFYSSELSARLCHAPDYCTVATNALIKMYAQVGDCTFDSHGKLIRGVLIRHLALPGYRADSMDVLRHLHALFPKKEAVRLSLMRQFTPMKNAADKKLSRPLTSLEYDRLVCLAQELGFLGYIQDKDSVTTAAIPNFDGTGVRAKEAQNETR